MGLFWEHMPKKGSQREIEKSQKKGGLFPIRKWGKKVSKSSLPKPKEALFWQKRFIKMGIGTDTRTHVDILPTQQHALQIRSVMLLDVTRVEEAGVGTVLNDETV